MTSYFNDIFSKILSGFQKKYSFKSTLAGTTAIDLSKAFVSVPQSRLIAKLAAYGFHLSACKLSASYLHNGKQYVKIQA